MAPTGPGPVSTPANASQSMFNVILVAPTANGVKQNSPEITYINRGSYTFQF